LPPLDPIVFDQPALLPPKHPNAPRMTLVLDLDETLVHSTTTPMREYDHTFSMVVHDINYQVWAKERPFVHHFLSEVSQLFEVVVFTASQELYAAKLLSLVDTKKVIQ
jgi:CTD small phosphatase-like protein 2